MKIKNLDSSCASKLKVLSDSTRLAVLEALMSGPQHVGKLIEKLKIEQSLLSHHLAILRYHELVESHRDGKAVIYQLPTKVTDSEASKAINLGCCKISFD